MGILVTGGAGFIGSHMVLELLDAGETAFDRRFRMVADPFRAAILSRLAGRCRY